VDTSADLLLDFPAEQDQLPTLDTADPMTLASIQQLSALFSAAPWSAQLPPLQFGCIDAAPGFIRSLVGEVIWHACWGSRIDDITPENWVPHKLCNIVRTVVSLHQGQMEAAQFEKGKVRFAEVESANAKRRSTPYAR
jgi:hypothetical protein